MAFSKFNLRFLFFLALTTLISTFVAFYVLGDSLSNDYVVQDDFRQTNFWFWNFWDKTLFSNDLFTNNYKDGFVRLFFDYPSFNCLIVFSKALMMKRSSFSSLINLSVQNNTCNSE